MATEFDDSEHWGFFLTGQKLTSETGKYVRMSSLVLAALRSAGVFSTMEDGTAPPATNKLWLDKNTDPPTLKEWDATGASWVPMTYGRLFGQAAVGFLPVTGGTGNAVVVSAPVGFQANRLYLITPTATNSGATTIQVSGVGTFNVRYGDGSNLVASEFSSGRQAVLFFSGSRFEVVFPSGDLNTSVVAAQAARDLAQQWASNPEDAPVTTSPTRFSALHWAAKAAASAAAAASTLAASLLRAGGTMTGQLVLATSTTSLAGLRVPNGVDPSSPADGDIWRRDAGGGLFVRKGAVSALLLDATNANQIIHVRDQKAQGTDAGTSISGGQVRVLNTVVSNSITGASLASNRVTLPAGTYELLARAPAFRSNRTKAWLRDAATNTIITGSSEYSGNTDTTAVSSMILGRFTLGTTTDVEIAQSFEVGVTTNGLGTSSNVSGQPEVFTEALFRRIS